MLEVRSGIWRRFVTVQLGGGMICLACGGEEKKPAQYPPPPAPTAEEAPDPSWDTGEARPEPEPEPEPAPATASPELKEPEFRAGMSVNEAISAVPSHYEYVGIEQEVLAKPLVDPNTYRECKLTPNDHFTVRIAVWDGRVVGADVTAKVPAKKDCIERAVRAIEYKEKVHAINTVEYTL